jgi:hypothetical protein
LVRIFVKTLFLTKTLCTYTMNYLHQEKYLRDHEAMRPLHAGFIILYRIISVPRGGGWRVAGRRAAGSSGVRRAAAGSGGVREQAD